MKERMTSCHNYAILILDFSAILGSDININSAKHFHQICKFVLAESLCSWSGIGFCFRSSHIAVLKF